MKSSWEHVPWWVFVSNGDATSHTHRRGRNHLGPVDLGRNPVPILEEMHDGIGRTGLGAAKSRQWRAPAPTRRPFNVFLSTPSQETKKKKIKKIRILGWYIWHRGHVAVIIPPSNKT
jgi:hypothetical protein